ncbi:MAG: ABC transporter permease [Clostridiales bacterium]|jgi:putative ABC transport system permease protein|nr:ABC transporter permease [Clostridiales bacterium]
MFLFENIALAVAGLRANKMRALLTMLGIIIGISSVIGIVTVGNSLTNSVTDQMQGMGATNIYVIVQEKAGQVGIRTDSGPTMAESDLISGEMIENYSRLYGSSIDAVSTMTSLGSGEAKDGRLSARVSVNAVNEGYIPANNVKMMLGRNITDKDVLAKRYVAVVSNKLVENMFRAGVNPLGQELRVNVSNQAIVLTIVGIYEYVENAMAAMAGRNERDIRTDLYIPVSTGQMVTSSDAGHSSFTVMMKPDIDVDNFTKKTEDFFNTYYENNTKFEIGVVSMQDALETMSTMLGTIQTAISVIAAISLLVGGIGVMNIMLVSVTERTREIGTRKALGARSSYIRVQFIIEAVIICAIGGIIGIIGGLGLGYAGAALLKFPASPSIGIIIIAVLFSMLIGIFFGYYPASKAAKLDPIEALRYE